MSEIIEVSQKEYDSFVQRLQLLRDSLATEIRKKDSAAGHGDLRENFEYESSKKTIDQLKSEIALAEEKLANMLITQHIQSSEIAVGSEVTLICLNTQAQYNFTLVAIDGCPPNKVSSTSKLGIALLGKRKGDTVSYIDNLYREQKFRIVGVQ